MKFLLDIGNSRIKWGCADIGSVQISHQGALTHQMCTEAVLETCWSSLPQPSLIAISSVAAEAIFKQAVSVAKRLWPESTMLTARSQAQAFAVTNAYSEPEKLGVDRWLTLVAIRYLECVPACVVDSGTALTLDVIDKNGIHQGGLIAPGIGLMQQALFNNAQQLSTLAQNNLLDLANNTESAIYNGTLLLAISLIDKVMHQQHQETRLFLTGGDAQCIAQHLAIDSTLLPDLVLSGLAVVAEQPK